MVASVLVSAARRSLSSVKFAWTCALNADGPVGVVEVEVLEADAADEDVSGLGASEGRVWLKFKCKCFFNNSIAFVLSVDDAL